MRAARARQIQVSQPAKKALLLVWKGGRADTRLPSPEAGKRQLDRAYHTHRPVQGSNAHDSRAFIQVRIGTRQATALVDLGSVRSCVDVFVIKCFFFKTYFLFKIMTYFCDYFDIYLQDVFENYK